MADNIIDKFLAQVKFDVDFTQMNQMDTRIVNLIQKVETLTKKFDKAVTATLRADILAAKSEAQRAKAALDNAKKEKALSEKLVLEKAQDNAKELLDHKLKNAEKLDNTKTANKKDLESFRVITKEKVEQIKTANSIERMERKETASLNILNTRKELQAERLAAAERRALRRSSGDSGLFGRMWGINRAALNVGGVGLLGGLAANTLMSGIVAPARERMNLETALTAITGTKEGGREEIEWLRSKSNFLGLNYLTAGDSYKQILASSLPNKDVGKEGARQIFTGFGSMATVLGLDTEQQKGMYRAIGQMLNKQQVMSEELKNQLGERFPAAMDIFTQAHKAVTGKDITIEEFLKLMEKRQVKSATVLAASRISEERAKQGGALDEKRMSDIAMQARAENAFTDIRYKMYRGGVSDALTRFFESLTKIGENETSLKNITDIIVGFIDSVTGFVEWIGSPAGKAVIDDLTTIFKFLVDTIRTYVFPVIHQLANMLENDFLRRMIPIAFLLTKAATAMSNINFEVITLGALGLVSQLGLAITGVLTMMARHPVVAALVGAGFAAKWLGEKFGEMASGTPKHIIDKIYSEDPREQKEGERLYNEWKNSAEKRSYEDGSRWGAKPPPNIVPPVGAPNSVGKPNNNNAVAIYGDIHVKASDVNDLIANIKALSASRAGYTTATSTGR